MRALLLGLSHCSRLRPHTLPSVIHPLPRFYATSASRTPARARTSPAIPTTPDTPDAPDTTSPATPATAGTVDSPDTTPSPRKATRARTSSATPTARKTTRAGSSLAIPATTVTPDTADTVDTPNTTTTPTNPTSRKATPASRKSSRIRPPAPDPTPTSTHPLPDRRNTLMSLYNPPGSTDTTPVILYHPYPTSHLPDLLAFSACRILTLTHPEGPPRFPHLLHDLVFAIRHTRTLFPRTHIGVFGIHSSGGLLLSATLTSPPGLISALGLFSPWTDIMHRVFPSQKSLQKQESGPLKPAAPELYWDENTASWQAAGVSAEVKEIYTDDPWLWQDVFASPALFFRRTHVELEYDLRAGRQVTRWVENPNPVNATVARPLNVPAVMVGRKKGDKESQDLMRFLDRGKKKGKTVFGSEMSKHGVWEVGGFLGRRLMMMDEMGEPPVIEEGEVSMEAEAEDGDAEAEWEMMREREGAFRKVELKRQGLDLEEEATRLREAGFGLELVQSFVDEGDPTWKLVEVVEGEEVDEGDEEEEGEEGEEGEEENKEEEKKKSKKTAKKIKD